MPRDVAFDEDDEIAQARKQAARDRKERLERGIFKLPAGETVFRILKTPADKQRKSPALFIKYYVHSKIGPKQRTLRCGKDRLDDSGKCWICDKMIPKLVAEGETAKAEEIRQIQSVCC